MTFPVPGLRRMTISIFWTFDLSFDLYEWKLLFRISYLLEAMICFVKDVRFEKPTSGIRK